jgi:hypothetical protein
LLVFRRCSLRGVRTILHRGVPLPD